MSGPRRTAGAQLAAFLGLPTTIDARGRVWGLQSFVAECTGKRIDVTAKYVTVAPIDVDDLSEPVIKHYALVEVAA